MRLTTLKKCVSFFREKSSTFRRQTKKKSLHCATENALPTINKMEVCHEEPLWFENWISSTKKKKLPTLWKVLNYSVYFNTTQSGTTQKHPHTFSRKMCQTTLLTVVLLTMSSLVSATVQPQPARLSQFGSLIKEGPIMQGFLEHCDEDELCELNRVCRAFVPLIKLRDFYWRRRAQHRWRFVHGQIIFLWRIFFTPEFFLHWSKKKPRKNHCGFF